MVWRKVCITHRHLNICVPQYPLKHKNITPVHHEMRREGVA